MTEDEHENEGLAADLRALFGRRRTLAVLGLGGAGAVLGWSFGGSVGRAEANVTATAADGGLCVKPAEETAGPFPADGTNMRDGQSVNALTESGVLRQDLRPSFAGLTPLAEGLPFEFEIRLVDVSRACAPLAGHAVYLWHCDADGKYSLYDLPGANYLRGLAISDADGMVRFTTIFPGCYDGRWPHLHFEVFASADAAVSGKQAILTSQFALPEDVSSAVYAGHPRYVTSADNLTRQSLGGDNVFADNSPEQMKVVTPSVNGDVATGLLARSTIGIQTA